MSEELNWFAYRRDELWQNGGDMEVGKVVWFGQAPCVVVAVDETEITFAAPARVMNVTRRL